tara:strand:- start:2388 stop:2630 length:243 start_codon:yes stop_codon:yes gene_type:complete
VCDELEIGDLVLWHNSKEFMGIVVDLNSGSYVDRAFIYWFTASTEAHKILGGGLPLVGAGWEPVTFLKVFKKGNLNKNKS